MKLLSALGAQLFSTNRDRELDADVSAISSSGLFDESYYLLNGSDVARAKVDPARHFCKDGWREGRRPNLFFDPHWYCDRYLGGLDVASNPLIHYITQGEAAGHWPINFFDPVWYRTEYRLPAHSSPLVHYIAHRRSQRVSPNGMFDLQFYLERHRAEIGPNRDPFMHFVRHGAAMRDHDPSSTFDSARYRREVMASDHTVRTGLFAHEMRVPLIHYLDGLVRPMPP